MSADDRTGDALALIEHCTDIGLHPDPLTWGTFERVLYEIGAAGLAEEDEYGEPSPETVNALQVIAGAFERAQATEAG